MRGSKLISALVLLVALLSCISPAWAATISSWGTRRFDGRDFIGSKFQAITAGPYHNLALKSDGSIVGWGADRFGQATPPDGNDYVAIAAGGDPFHDTAHSLALRSDGSIVGWGAGWWGQTTPPDGNDYVAIAAGGEHSLALKSDGSIVAWGRYTYGTPDGNDYVAIAAGFRHSLALKSDGSIVGWGAWPTPPDGNDYVAIAAGESYSLALKSDGSIVAWGASTWRRDWNDCVAIAAGGEHYLFLKSDGSIMGLGNDYCGQATPPDGNDYVAIAAGVWHSLALKADGSIVSWGCDEYGVAIPPVGDDYAAVAAGESHGLALKTDGSIVGWGDDFAGQATPPGGNDYAAIAAGRVHSLALKADGSIVGWGSDYFGQATPPGGNDYVAIAARDDHSLALKSDGSIVAWGGSNDPPAGNDYVAIATGWYHSLALKADGSIVGWGSNTYGQTSPPHTSDYCVAIAAGGYHSLALKSDGSIVAWGWGGDSAPAGNDYVAIAAGQDHSLALKSDGSIVGWGADWHGQATPPDGNDYVAIAAGPGYSLALIRAAVIYYVDANASGLNDGSSWCDAYNHLQDALAAAACGDEILVAQGIYKPDQDTANPDGTDDRRATFQLKNGLALRGGYAGCGADDPNARDTKAYATILSGDLAGNDLDVGDLRDLLTEPTRAENSLHVVTGSRTIKTAILDGFTITAGNANGAGYLGDHGGGMFNAFGSPTVINCTFRGNSANGASGSGAGMFNGDASNPTVLNCRFTGNSCTWGGGGMANDNGSSPTVTNCLFSGNLAGHHGGGMANWNAYSLTISNCTFTDNVADSNGGGISGDTDYRRCIAKLPNCIVWGNNAPEDAQICDLGYNWTMAAYSDIQGGWPGNGNIDADPLFVDPNNGDYHLLPDSPCIDTAENHMLPPDGYDLDGDGNTVEPIPFDLDGNARIADGNDDGNSVVDMGAYEYFVPPIQVSMRFTPQALNPDSKGNWMKAHFVLPEGYAVGDVDANRPAVVEPGGIESDHINVFVNDDGLVEIEAAFGRAEFCGIVTGGEPMEVRVVGSLTSGQQFYGTDTIKITTNYLKYLGTLASRWLESGCGKPDWCSGLDLDQDSAVDFVDYALFDGCCIEVIRQ